MTSNPLRFGLKETTIQQIQDVFAQYPDIEKAIIYGSRAKGNYRTGSDIDITLVGNHLTYGQLSRIETQLDNLQLVYSIDLSLFKYLNAPDLIDHIKRVGIIFYGSVAKSPTIDLN